MLDDFAPAQRGVNGLRLFFINVTTRLVIHEQLTNAPVLSGALSCAAS
jgi:hypothetical protein